MEAASDALVKRIQQCMRHNIQYPFVLDDITTAYDPSAFTTAVT